jgi:hypothetical protein
MMNFIATFIFFYKIAKKRNWKKMPFVSSTSQNDRLNLSFAEYIYADGEKVARNGHKTAI